MRAARSSRSSGSVRDVPIRYGLLLGFAVGAAALLLPGAGCGGGTATPDGGGDASRPEAGRDSTSTTNPDAPDDETGAPLVDAADASPGLDATKGAEAGQCPSACHAASDCATCPTAFLTDYCCDPGAGGIGCYPYSPDVPCPAHAPTAACADAGCADGEVCVTYVQGPDPPEIVPPACYLVPGACANDPTCGCEAEAGLCSASLGYTPDCSSGSIQCLPLGL